MTGILGILYHFVWGIPTVAAIAGTGILLSIAASFPQVRFLPVSLSGLKEIFSGRRKTSKDSSCARALCTALAATVGTGNLVGVAGAISLGGPGAVFWMWICAFLGMAVKYAETTLAVYYRVRIGNSWHGGPMYILSQGLGCNWLAGLYALLGAAACFGIGNTAQVNAIVTGLNDTLSSFGICQSCVGNLIFGLAIELLVGFILLGGAERIGKAAELLVPAAALFYFGLCLLLLIRQHRLIPYALRSIFVGAFSPKAVTGGAIGSAAKALITGCSRGVFSNEAGMGTASIAHAGADAAHPCQQGILGIAEVFLDTFVICTITAMVILCSGHPVPYGVDGGFSVTADAFAYVLGPWVYPVLTICIGSFAFATILGWGLYGGRCAQYLWGDKAYRWFSAAQTIMVIPGAMIQTRTIWQAAEILNGLMILPNLIAIILLIPLVVRLTKEYTMNVKQ